MSSQRLGIAAVTSVVLAAGLPIALAAPHRPPAARAAAGAAREIVYLTAGDRIEQVRVSAGGRTGQAERIAPAAGTPKADFPSFVVGSPDGRWLAWTQARGNRRPLLYLRNLTTGGTTTFATNDQPVGFAGDQLLLSFNHTFRLVTQPKPHLVAVPGAKLAFAGYAHGAIDVKVSSDGASGTLRLTSFSGKQTPLHHYTDFSTPDYRDLDAGWVSPDNRELLVERGNHQDFDGLGPSSLLDGFALTGGHARTQFGHYPGSEVWRVTDAAFRGAADAPYVTWEAQTRSGVRTLVARFAAGQWTKVAGGAIAVAADRRGDLLVQSGRYLAPHTRGNRYDYPQAAPTRRAQLTIGSRQYSLRGVRGITFWLAAG